MNHTHISSPGNTAAQGFDEQGRVKLGKAGIDSLKSGQPMNELVASMKILMEDKFNTVNKYSVMNMQAMQDFSAATTKALHNTPISRTFRKLMSPTSTLQFSDLWESMQGRTLHIKDTAFKVGRSYAKMIKDVKGRTQSKVEEGQVMGKIFSFMGTRDAPVSTLPEMMTEAEKAEVVQFKEIISAYGQQLVDHGVLAEETYLKNDGGYMWTVYSEYATTMSFGKGNQASSMGYLRPKHLTDEMHAASKGPIQDPEFIGEIMLSNIGRDVAVLRFTESIAEVNKQLNLGWILDQGESITLQTGETFPSIFEAENKLTEWRNYHSDGVNGTIHGYSQAESDSLAGRILELQAAVDGRMAGLTKELQEHVQRDQPNRPEMSAAEIKDIVKSEYKQLPNDVRFGALRGKWVRREIADQFVDNFRIYDKENMDFVAKILMPGGWLERMNAFWKAVKVPLNIPSWPRNGFGNLALLDIATDSSTATVSRNVIDVISAYYGRGGNSRALDMLLAMNERGATGVTMGAQELYNQRDEMTHRQQEIIRGELEAAEGSNLSNLMFNPHFTKIMDTYSSVTDMTSMGFGVMEGWFKAAHALDFVNRWEGDVEGRSFDALTNIEQRALLDKAYIESNKAVFNYSDVPSWVSTSRRAPLGSPFLTFMYKALPATMRGLAHHPQKFLKYIMAPYMMQAVAMSMFDWDEDEIDEAYRTLPDHMRTSGTVLLPNRDANGRPQFLSAGYILPWAPFMDLIKAPNVSYKSDEPFMSTVTGTGKQALSTFGVLGGVTPNLITAFGSGKDPFTGQDIIPAGADSSDKLIAMMKFGWDQFTPSMLGSYGIMQKTMDQYGISPLTPSRQLSAYGTDRETGGQTFGRAFGINVTGVDAQEAKRNIRKKYDRRLREVNQAWNSARRNYNISDQEKASILKAHLLKVKLIREQRRNELGG